jgi:CubicO group peptidase (beta-lactamase class C family)
MSVALLIDRAASAMRHVFPVAAVAMLAVSANAQNVPTAWRDFDVAIPKAMADWKVPGLAIAVVKDDSVIFMQGYGVRSVATKEPVTVHTRFGVMSTTKAFTTMLLAMLADSGKLAWDDPAIKYEPRFRLGDPWATREVTLRDLVTHRIGFPDPSYLWYDRGLNLDGILARLPLVPAASSLRSRFAYNNVAYGIAGAIAGRAAGTTWDALLAQRIYAPLGMTESSPDEGGMWKSGVTDVSAPHVVVRDTIRVLKVTAPIVDPVAPAGAMFASIGDMSKWVRFLLDSGRVKGKRLVSAANFRELFTPQQIVPAEEFYPTARLTKPHVTAYGLGWFLEDYRGEWVAMHTGSIDGRSAIVGLLPDKRIGVIVLENVDHAELRHALLYMALDKALDKALGAPKRDWSAEFLPMYRGFADTAAARAKARDAKRVTTTSAPVPLDRYVGTYGDSLYGRITIAMEQGKLVAHSNGVFSDDGGEMEHWQNGTFRIRWRQPLRGEDDVAFDIAQDGTVEALRYPDSPVRLVREAKPTR